MLAASPAAQRAQAPLVPARHLGAPGAVTPTTSRLIFRFGLTAWPPRHRKNGDSAGRAWSREATLLLGSISLQQVAHSGLQHRPACPARSSERAASCSAAASSGSGGTSNAGPVSGTSFLSSSPRTSLGPHWDMYGHVSVQSVHKGQASRVCISRLGTGRHISS